MREYRSDLSKGTLTFHVSHTPSITVETNQEARHVLRQIYRKGERLVAGLEGRQHDVVAARRAFIESNFLKK